MSQSSGSSGDPPDDERVRATLDEHVQGHVTENVVTVEISPSSIPTPTNRSAEPVQQNVSTPTPNPSNPNPQLIPEHVRGLFERPLIQDNSLGPNVQTWLSTDASDQDHVTTEAMEQVQLTSTSEPVRS